MNPPGLAVAGLLAGSCPKQTHEWPSDGECVVYTWMYCEIENVPDSIGHYVGQSRRVQKRGREHNDNTDKREPCSDQGSHYDIAALTKPEDRHVVILASNKQIKWFHDGEPVFALND